MTNDGLPSWYDDWRLGNIDGKYEQWYHKDEDSEDYYKILDENDLVEDQEIIDFE